MIECYVAYRIDIITKHQYDIALFEDDKNKNKK